MIDVPAMRDQRIDAFCTHCLIMPLPGGMTVDALREDYFPALDWLFNEAERMAGALDEEGKEVKKKSAASLSGRNAGRAGANSTISLRDPGGWPSATDSPALPLMDG
jgi:hypothetical protein